MGKQANKIFILIFIVGLIVSFSTSCNIVKGNNSYKKDSKESKTPITFDWYVDFSWFRGKWGTNPVSKYITEKTGVNVNFIIPSGDETEKIEAMIDTGKLPDFITLHAAGDGYKKIIKSNLALALDQLSEQYDAYFMKVADDQVLDWYKQNDGHVYSYPNYSNPLKDINNFKDPWPSNQVFLVRKDIYEAIGKPDMRTTEGFLAALKKAKEMFPLVNGQELIPIGFHEFNNVGNTSLDWILPNFLAIPFEKDGEFNERTTDIEYIRWLKTFRKANEDGLLSKDIFLDRRAQIEEKTSEGRYFSLLYLSSDMAMQQLELYSEDRDKIYIPVPGPANSNLDEPKLAGDSITGWTVTLISKTCKDPKKAIEFLSYLISEEGQRDLYLGVEGLTWDVIDGKEQFKPEVVELLNKDRIAFDNKYGGAYTYWMLADSKVAQKWMPVEAEPVKALKDWTRDKTYNYSVYENVNPYGNSKEAIAFSEISNKWAETLKSLLVANSEEEFDNILNEFLAYRNQQGFDRLQQYRKKKMEENKKRLKVATDSKQEFNNGK